MEEARALRGQRLSSRSSAAAVGPAVRPVATHQASPTATPRTRSTAARPGSVRGISVLVRVPERGASLTHAKDVVDTDRQIPHVADGTGQLDYYFYLSLLRDFEVPLIAQGLSEQQVPGSLAFLRATTQ